ncbi:MAG: signal peptidase I [Alphaproteobacteria bacterium]|nr:signal peptidase I [Alphaproteobacteria bacterium]
MKEKKKSGFRETVETIVYAVLIAVLVRTFAYEPFNIPSGSMIPTLWVGDYLFVSKFSYGYSRHSFPFSLPLFSGRVFFSEPERGDIAVFKLPRDDETDYIKRIIGLPGDKIQVISGVLHVNGEPVRRRRIEDYALTDNGRVIRRTQQYVETLPGGHRHLLIEEEGDSGRLDNTPVYTVPKKHYFAMGDNRDNSQDSRVLELVGFIPAENLVGRAEILFFSSNGSARIWEVWKWPGAIRFSRLFQKIN